MNQRVLHSVLFCLLSTALNVTGAVVGIDLQPVNDWTYDGSGHPTRYDIFCSAALIGVPAPPSFTARQALDALCSSRSYYFKQPLELTTALMSSKENRQPYFSKSALDTYLAGRFGGKMSYGNGFWASNKSDIPWSSDPVTPWMVADYLISASKTQHKGDMTKAVIVEGQLDVMLCSNPQCTALVDLRNITQQAGQAGVLAMAVARANDLWASGLNTLQQPISASIHSRDDWVPEQFKITPQAEPWFSWRRLEPPPTVQAATWLEPGANIQGSTSAPIGLAQQALLRNNVGPVLPWVTATRLNVNHVNHTRVGLYQAVLQQASSKGDFPRGSCVVIVWPDNQWMHQHHWGLSAAGDVCDCRGSSPEYINCPVYLFDTYLVKDSRGYTGYTINLLAPEGQQTRTVFEDGCLCRNDTSVPVCTDTAGTAASAGLSARACCRQRCSVLHVGNATIAAVPLQLDSKADDPLFTAEALGTLSKMYVMATTYNASVMPWCGPGGLACDSPLFGHAGDPQLERYAPANNTYTMLQDAVVTYGVVRGPYLEGDRCLAAIAGYYCVEGAAVVEGLKSIVQDATRVVDRVATAELGTTDFISSVQGALARISLTMAALVAMAVGRNDMMEGIKTVVKDLRQLCHRPPATARVNSLITICSWLLTLCIVMYSVALPATIALTAEKSARDNNPDGRTSQVCLVAADASLVGPNSAIQPYVVVGVLSVRATAQSSQVAWVLTCVNLGLAYVGCYCIMSWPIIKQGWRRFLEGTPGAAAGGTAGAQVGGAGGPPPAGPPVPAQAAAPAAAATVPQGQVGTAPSPAAAPVALSASTFSAPPAPVPSSSASGTPSGSAASAPCAACSSGPGGTSAAFQAAPSSGTSSTAPTNVPNSIPGLLPRTHLSGSSSRIPGSAPGTHPHGRPRSSSSSPSGGHVQVTMLAGGQPTGTPSSSSPSALSGSAPASGTSSAPSTSGATGASISISGAPPPTGNP